MPQYGYLIDVVRLHVLRDKDTSVEFDNLGSLSPFDQLVLNAADAARQDSSPIVDEKYEQAFDVLDCSSPRPGVVWVRAEAGRYGSSGNTTNVDSGQRRAFGERDAAMTPKRAMLWAPHGAPQGLFFSERVGASHIRGQVEKHFMRPAAHAAEVSLKLSNFVDVAAWEKYIDEAQGARVQSVWRPTTIEQQVDGSGRLRDEGELKMALSGLAAWEMVKRFRDKLHEKFAGGTSQAVEIEVPRALTPQAEDDYERRRVEVALDGPDGQTRTLVFEKDQPPAFVYQLGERLADDDLMKVWKQETVRVGKIVGEDVLPGWHD